MKFQYYLWIWLALLVLWHAPAVQAQVSLAPVVVVVHDNTNAGALYVSNRSNEAQEVSITMNFGYPDSDSLGNLVMNYEDMDKAENYGLDNNIRVFPQNFILEPNQQQTVRLQVLPDRNRPDGVYWTRASVTSNAVTQDAESQISEGITTRINYRFEQNIGVFYRNGNTTTGVDVEDIAIERNENRISVIPRVARTGNSPFLGSMTVELYNASGEKVRESQTPTTVYFNEKKKLGLDVEGLPSGTYRVDLHFDTRRRDISPNDIVQAPRATETRTIEL